MSTYAKSYPDFHIIHYEDELLEGRWYASPVTWRVIGQYMSSYDRPYGRIHRFTGDGEHTNAILFYGGLVDVTDQITDDESDTEQFCCCLFSRKRHYT